MIVQTGSDESDKTNGNPLNNSDGMIQAVNVRSVSLVILATVATLFFIDWAQAILLPLVVAVLISYALDPLVTGLERLRLPRTLAAGLVITVVIAICAAASVPLKDEAMDLLNKIPQAVERFQREEARNPVKEESVIEKAQEAAIKIEETTASDDKRDSSRTRATLVRIAKEPFDLRNFIMQGSPAALVLFSQVLSVLLLVFFLLAVGKLYRLKVVRIAGPSFGRMRKAAHIMADFHHQVRRFLFVTLIGAVFVGIITWLAFMALGFEQAGLWGVLAGVASAVPYLGPVLIFLATGAAAFVQFGSVNMALAVSLTSLIITSIQGNILTPVLTARVSSLNAVVIFIGLLVWGWLWGPVGLIVATPLLMMTKSLCDSVVNLRPLGELLGK
ncbi:MULTISPECIES: AI-2E family transporter [unclassified Marinobacter]|uniref:AI-2E family transporter n=1 Tax=unclassified Marinobacter TaxID=83889 RepID=UPI000C017346|nr:MULTISPECIES: AI-2E family transporter [unclassified Marinobacter]PFG08511.1 putative PurR-regulated permease PerM [Marinobacter sp. LV10MA510-1]PFG54363.1 putative PurR-regulated permease PerM [Marinobacter sp. LV10R520-4]